MSCWGVAARKGLNSRQDEGFPSGCFNANKAFSKTITAVMVF